MKLTARQRRSLLEWLRKGVKANGFMDGRWTCLRIVELMERKYGVRYHTTHIARLLRSLGWSYP